jgi:thiamine-monophosphate kinase
VTGTIGDGALGLQIRADGATAARWNLGTAEAAHLTERYLLPEPRLAMAEALRRCATAAMDVSDGLAGDLAKLCRVSGVSAEIAVENIPLSAGARAALAADPTLIEPILSGGDDYEVLCTIGEGKFDDFRRAAAAAGVPVTEIGRVVEGRSLPAFRDRAGRPVALGKLSFSHF